MRWRRSCPNAGEHKCGDCQARRMKRNAITTRCINEARRASTTPARERIEIQPKWLAHRPTTEHATPIGEGERANNMHEFTACGRHGDAASPMCHAIVARTPPRRSPDRPLCEGDAPWHASPAPLPPPPECEKRCMRNGHPRGLTRYRCALQIADVDAYDACAGHWRKRP